ncbi:MAG: hypothetical protein HYV09_26885 [Deltaproteobacteria bacterium]|nr:hypothetical protein [Deltaproteobacteria bacterium]
MNDFIAAFGGTATAAGAIFVFFRFFGGKWIELWFSHDLEKVRARHARELGEDLERLRASAAADLETRRHHAAEYIERLRAELAHDVEARRLAAQRKVEMLMTLLRETDDLMELVQQSPTSVPELERYFSSLKQREKEVRALGPLVCASSNTRLHEHLQGVLRGSMLATMGLRASNQSQHAEGVELLNAAREALHDVVRAELGIAERAHTPSTPSPCLSAQ